MTRQEYYWPLLHLWQHWWPFDRQQQINNLHHQPPAPSYLLHYHSTPSLAPLRQLAGTAPTQGVLTAAASGNPREWLLFKGATSTPSPLLLVTEKLTEQLYHHHTPVPVAASSARCLSWGQHMVSALPLNTSSGKGNFYMPNKNASPSSVAVRSPEIPWLCWMWDHRKRRTLFAVNRPSAGVKPPIFL